MRLHLSNITIYFLILFACIVALFPLYFMITTSFKTSSQYSMNLFGLPKAVTLRNYVEILMKHNFLRLFFNSVLITSISVFSGAMVASIASFAFAKMNFKGRTLLQNGIIALMVVPPIVLVVPLFVLMTIVGFINNYTSVIITYIGLTMPFSIYLLTSFFKTIPDELIDAAIVDGCTTFKAFYKIVLPLAKPAVTTVIVINALWVWNELLISLMFLQSDKMRTLMVGITAFQGKYDLNIPLIMAGMLIATIPMIIMYLFSQRYFTRGLIAGSLK